MVEKGYLRAGARQERTRQHGSGEDPEREDERRVRPSYRKVGMNDASRRDVARQAANVFGALFQVIAGLLLAPELSGENHTLIQPAGYAFVIWAPIFLLSLAYAVYQTLPSKRTDALLRRVGWPLAGAFWLNGALEVLAYPGLAVLTEALVVGTLLCLAVAYLRLVRSEHDMLGAGNRWLVVLPLGLFLGWIAAATVVGASQTLSFLGLPAGGTIEALVGAVLLLLGALLARTAILVGKAGPARATQAYLAYGAAVLWALVGIAIGQYDASILTTAAAAVSAVLVALALRK